MIMKSVLSFHIFLTLTALAAAQIPICAATCIANAVASNTTCSPTDLVCQCQSTNLEDIEEASTSCVIKICPEPIAVLNAAKLACSSVLASTSVSTFPTTAAASIFAADSTINGPAASTDPSSDPTIINGLTTTDYGSSVPTSPSILANGSAPNNVTATKFSHTPQVTAGAGSKLGFDAAGSIFAFGMAILAAL
ncbi:hypothetical protein N431DRAFT_460267 [Stipitochalara longipes BDJ]|nr:hypothetical protein N431DRAFT_460267 [Stipitochalara longipes BDJ]